MENLQLNHRPRQAGSPRLPLRILASDMLDPRNVGSLFRIGDAFGVQCLHLCGNSPRPPSREIRRTSRSTENHVPHDYAEDATEVVRSLKAEGWRIISLEITTASIDLRDLTIARNEPACLIVGSENTGVSQPLLDLSDDTVHIAMLGHNSSMNVATACAVATYEIVRHYRSR